MIYSLRMDSEVELEFFNYLGNRLLRKQCNPGTEGGRRGINRIPWDGRDSRGIVSGSGGYVCRITVTSPTDKTKNRVTRKIGIIWER